MYGVTTLAILALSFGCFGSDEPKPDPAPETPPYIIVVDFYAGNTHRDPGTENCNPQRCGAAMVQFSRPVLVVEYEDETVRLGITEPVRVQMQSESDVGILVRLEDGSTVRGLCAAPEFDVPGLTPRAIAMSFDLATDAAILDDEGQRIEEGFEYVTLSQIVTISVIDSIPLDMPDMTHKYWVINVYFTDLVWVDGGHRCSLRNDGCPCLSRLRCQ